jgi:transposase
LATTFGAVDDGRAADQLSYSLRDTLMSGLAVMFFQHPRLLQFQRARAKKRQRCNLQTIFGGHEVPSDTQRRELLDAVKPDARRGALPELWEKVRRAGWGKRFTTTLPRGQHQGTYYTVALDGSEYFRSTTIQCPHCLRQTDPQGRVHYSHKIVGATVVRAGSHQVLPLNQDA